MIFKGFSVAINCLRPESAPVSATKLFFFPQRVYNNNNNNNNNKTTYSGKKIEVKQKIFEKIYPIIFWNNCDMKKIYVGCSSSAMKDRNS